MPHVLRARNHLDVSSGHLRIAIDDGEVDPVKAVIFESMLARWEQDRALLNDYLYRETP